MSENNQQLPTDILAEKQDDYEPTDIFQWANNLVQYKDELNIDLFFFNKNGIVYRTSRSKAIRARNSRRCPRMR